MTTIAYQTYEPTGVLKAVAHDVWIVDGPEIRFRYGFLRMPFPTRMTVIRLPGGHLWLHSPTPISEPLVAQLSHLGPVGHLVAPNSIHYWWVRDWKLRFPQAEVWAVARLDSPAQRRGVPRHVRLGGEPPPAWGGALEQVILEGTRLMEAEFFHVPSRTLLITDLIENFETDRFNSAFYRWLAHIGGVIDPDGKAPLELRWSFAKNRAQLRAAAQRMLAWNPQRVIMAHGRWYSENAVNELRRAFRWAL